MLNPRSFFIVLLSLAVLIGAALLGARGDEPEPSAKPDASTVATHPGSSPHVDTTAPGPRSEDAPVRGQDEPEASGRSPMPAPKELRTLSLEELAASIPEVSYHRFEASPLKKASAEEHDLIVYRGAALPFFEAKVFEEFNDSFRLLPNVLPQDGDSVVELRFEWNPEHLDDVRQLLRTTQHPLQLVADGTSIRDVFQVLPLEDGTERALAHLILVREHAAACARAKHLKLAFGSHSFVLDEAARQAIRVGSELYEQKLRRERTQQPR